TACSSAGLPANLQTGLVGYWPFCGNANDESGNGNNGSVNGATLITDQYGTPNSAYSFFSEDDYISLSENLVFTDADGFTVSIWMKKEDLTGYLQGYLFDISDGLSQNQWQQRIAIQTGTAEDGSQKAINFYGEGSEGLSWQCITTDVDEFENQWINIVGVVDMSSNAVKLYINGIEAANSNTSEGFDSISLGQGNSTSKILGRRSTLVPISNRFYGEMDDLAIWNRALTETEVQQLVNSSTYIWSTGDTTENISVTPTETTEYWVDVTTNGVTCREYVTINITAPAAPTGDLEQTFCNSATVADLTATGDNIQWYDVETGGNLLGTATALIDGQVLYASQIIEGCESTDRLEVSVSIQNITITASATEVCAGESVDLSVVGDVNSTYLWSTGESNFSGQGTLVDEYSLVANTVSQNTFSIIPGNIYRLEVSGTISLGGGAGNQRDVAYYIQSGSDGTVEGTPFDSECNLRIWTSLFCENPGLRPSPDIYDPTNHTYSYPFTSNSSSIEVGFWDSPLVDNGPDVVTFKLYELSNSESIITVNPTETTEYWVDVTTNSVTCREYITIDVTAPAAPTGNSVQGGCSDFTVGTNNNAFTGENMQWYAAPSGGTALPDSHLLADGTYYFISQTVDGCESSDRFEFLYLAPQPIITIDNSVICEGDIATVSVSSSPSLGSATFLWNTGETSESITLSPTESSTFWVDQIYSSGGPENIQTVCRYFFGIIVDNAPEAPISGGDITECETNEAQNLVATASANAGESITWYDAATGSNVVANPSLGTAGTVTFFAEAINNNSGCASLTRIAVTLTINSVTTPTGDAVQSFCDNVNVSDLSAVGSNIQWYDADTGGNILDPSSALSDGQVLYASQTQNGCESITRLEVSVEIDVIPDPILITTELEFCLAREATLADLELDDQGFALEWYDSFNGGNMLPMDTLLEDGISYYTTLYDAVSGCESLMRLEVVPTVIPCEVIIYNALSLNGNGQNDYMVIENAEYFPDNSLEVYNRDGHLIYSQTQYGVDDNLFRGVANVGNIYGGGTIYNSSSGSNLPTGSYLYVFKYFNPYEQQQYALKGFLTINSN
ncbi:MAG: gliding motility-associated C-terminal domain-containing protein, partial [Flavobacteriaceae bacterium]|nr:gliding motility-associated C-terminal domain-containing protein [Flavobacteriaceae bacterium]